jgi:O-antigen/teichoic acid export membrane protein
LNPIKTLFGQTAIYGMGTVVPRLLNYVVLTPFFTRVFQLGEYGIVTELYAYVVFLMVILTYGMETGYFRYAEKHEDPDEVFATALISLFASSTLFITIVTVFSQPIANIVGYPNNHGYFIMIGIIVGVDAFTAIPFARLRQQNKALKFAVLKIAGVVINIALNFLFLYFIPKYNLNEKFKFISVIYSENIGVGYVFISNLVASLATLLFLLDEIIKVRIKFNGRLWKEIIYYSLPLLVAGLAGTVNEALDRIMLKHLIPDYLHPLEKLGIYGANYKIAVLMQLFVQMFRFAAEPFYFSKAKEKGAESLFGDVMKYFVIACMLIFLMVTLYLDVFKHFIGRKFYGGLDIVPIILYAIFLLGVFFNLSMWYKLRNLTQYGAIITIGGALITVIINWIFIPKYGYIASAWAHFACYLSMVIVSYFLGQHFYRINYDLKAILLYALLPVAIFIFTKWLDLAFSGIKIAIHTALFMFYIVIVIIKEKPDLKALLIKK